MVQSEFDAILADGTKRIEGDVVWARDPNHLSAYVFRAEVLSESGWPIMIKGSFNPKVRALSYTLLHKGVGRIYALDLGKAHHNPTCQTLTGDKHKHTWREGVGTKHAYVPDDITETVDNLAGVWHQFCAEARINHPGRMFPILQQEELF